MSGFEFVMKDTFGDPVTVDLEYGRVYVRASSGARTCTASLDRNGAKKLRKALKGALKALDE